MRLSRKETIQFMIDSGHSTGASNTSITKIKRRLREHTLKRIHDIANSGFEIQHVRRVDTTETVERLKLLYGGTSKSERMRDSDFHNYETAMDFQDFSDSKQLESLDKFKSKSITQWGDPNKVHESNNDREINEYYIKAKKEYLLMIDRG